ncbi:MAG: M20/M25/M40 family metallo-hydrolase [Sulfurisoma sp.]|nr:M20/M25/M40 family metallo-hydrolase [Sulfurisoma sp.]
MKADARGSGLWVWLALLLALAAGLRYMTHMPGRSHSGPLPPLSVAETGLRERLGQHVAVLAGEIGERNLWRHEALEASAAYIEKAFQAAGYEVTSQAYVVRGKTVRNLEAVLPGTSRADEIVLIGAHYDSVAGSPGANDNASGVAALLEIARLLAQQKPARSVRFAAFVNEEPPFFYTPEMGSRVHARRARERGEKIAAMLSLETIGYYADAPGSQHYPFPFSPFYPDTGNFIAFVGNLASRELVQACLASFRSRAAFPSEGIAAPGWMGGVHWSDHWSFWREGYPAIMVTDTALYRYEHYHARTDTPEKIDYERLARVVTGLAGVTLDLAAEQDALVP